jgi:hypothetical protein
MIEGRWDQWIIDFNDITDIRVASGYEQPFEYCRRVVLPAREKGETEEAIERYWVHWRARPTMREALTTHTRGRFVVTPRVARHRLFIWVGEDWLPSDATVAIARDDDQCWGILQSRVHEVWVRSTTSQLREAESGLRYSHQLCFETFPFPKPTEAQQAPITVAAREVDTLRNNWLNPAEWTRDEVLEFPGSTDGPWRRYIDPATVPNNPRQSRGLPRPSNRTATSETTSAPGSAGGSSAIGTVRYPRIVPKDEECAAQLKKRTLTNLYNERPTWLDLAHKRLDAAVFAAYGWDPAISDDDLLAALLTLNLERASAQ